MTEIFKTSMLFKGYLHCLCLSDNEGTTGRNVRRKETREEE